MFVHCKKLLMRGRDKENFPLLDLLQRCDKFALKLQIISWYLLLYCNIQFDLMSMRIKMSLALFSLNQAS